MLHSESKFKTAYETPKLQFIYKDIEKIKNIKILELGVREGISTSLFLKLCEENDGKLVSNETTIELIKQFINENKNSNKGFLFDGFPRNRKQAELLDHLMESINEKILCVILLNVNEDVLKERIMNRSTTEGRSDDNLETLSKRLHTYSSETEPLIEYYSSQNLVRKVHGTGEISDINQGISSHIEASLNA